MKFSFKKNFIYYDFISVVKHKLKIQVYQTGFVNFTIDLVKNRDINFIY